MHIHSVAIATQATLGRCPNPAPRTQESTCEFYAYSTNVDDKLHPDWLPLATQKPVVFLAFFIYVYTLKIPTYFRHIVLYITHLENTSELPY